MDSSQNSNSLGGARSPEIHSPPGVRPRPVSPGAAPELASQGRNAGFAQPATIPFSDLVSGLERNPSREDLIDAITELLPSVGSGRRQGALLIAAVGNLSMINDAFGFHVGDEVLTIVGRRLRGCLRERDCFSRFGTNKFGILLADCEPDQLEFVAKRLIRSIRDTIIETSVGAVSVTIRIGGVLIPRQAKTTQEAFSNALDALDHARTKRGDCFKLFDDSEGRVSDRKRNILIVDEVIRALNDRRMVLAVQPIICCGNRATAFYECLLRMQKPDGTFVSAGEFIQVAEKLGLSRMIDHRVVELAVGLLKSAPKLKLSMNVSGETATDPEWLAMLCGLTHGDRSLTRRLMVEITETAAIAEIEESAGFVRSLKEIGCQVAIDDFGAGYSTFKNLRRLDVDMVKIDGSFVRNLKNSREDGVFVRALIELARSFSVKTVAEWVGDEDTAVLLESAGAHFMQGFYFGQPRLVGVHVAPHQTLPRPAQAAAPPDLAPAAQQAAAIACGRG